MQLKKRSIFVRTIAALVIAGVLLGGTYLFLSMDTVRLNVINKVAPAGSKGLKVALKSNARLKNIEKLELEKSTRKDVIEKLGEPDAYYSDGRLFEENNLPDTYAMVYGDVCVLMLREIILQISIYGPGVFLKGSIQIGSSEEDTLKVLGKPVRIVEWKDSEQGIAIRSGTVPFTEIYEDRVLYTHYNQDKVQDYYPVYSIGALITFYNGKVSEIILSPVDNWGN